MYLTLSVHVCTYFTAPTGAPRNLTAQGISSSSARLSWWEPDLSHRNGEMTLYELKYHPQSNSVDEEKVNTTDQAVMIEGLDIDTNYYFYIKAYTSQGAGPWSNRFQFRTFGQCKLNPLLEFLVQMFKFSSFFCDVDIFFCVFKSLSHCFKQCHRLPRMYN